METTKKLQSLTLERSKWLEQHLPQDIRTRCLRFGIDIPIVGGEQKNENRWGDFRYHLANRISPSTVSEFLELFPEYCQRETELRRYLENYDLSILPLNLMQPEGVCKFLPRVGLQHGPDPYGIQQTGSVITQVEDGVTYYVTTHKPEYATFLPVLGSAGDRVVCPIGCAGCYRGPQTRAHQPLGLRHADGQVDKLTIPKPQQQIKWLVDTWNTDPGLVGVYDVLMSGGEPMMFPNVVWQELLKTFEKAVYLRSLRICTGALFLGLPFRFDDEFIRLLTDFRNQTGISVKLSVHVSHPEHITPESLIYADRLNRAGIELLPQIPLEPGVNFWASDLDRTVTILRQLDRLLSLAVGTRPYKWILDMQGGVPLLLGVEVWRRLHDLHHGESDITRPTSFALFLPGKAGNTNLSYHSLWAMKVSIENDRVQYRIPHPSGSELEYHESYWEGIEAWRHLPCFS